MESSISFFDYLEKNDLESSIDAQGMSTLISIKGIPAHGSTPKNVVNAITHLANFFVGINKNKLTLSIDVRFPYELTSTIIGEVTSTRFNNAKFSWTKINEPLYYSPDSKLMSTLYSIYQEFTGDYCYH